METRKNFVKKGIQFGLGATVVMTIIMLIGMGTGISPIPEPIPAAIARLLLGEISQPALMITGMLMHLIYGSVAGGILAYILSGKTTIWYGLVWGVVLWLIMQFIVLPLLGWGIFGTAITPKIAMATLVLHLIYGGILGWGLQWAARGSKVST